MASCPNFASCCNSTSSWVHLNKHAAGRAIDAEDDVQLPVAFQNSFAVQLWFNLVQLKQNLVMMMSIIIPLSFDFFSCKLCWLVAVSWLFILLLFAIHGRCESLSQTTVLSWKLTAEPRSNYWWIPPSHEQVQHKPSSHLIFILHFALMPTSLCINAI